MSNWKKTLPILAIYGLALGAAFLLEEISSNDPWELGFGLLLFVLLPIVSFLLLLDNLVQLVKGQVFKKPIVFAHLIAFATFMVTLFI